MRDGKFWARQRSGERYFLSYHECWKSIRVWNPKVWGLIPHGDSEFFLCPTLVTKRKKLLSLCYNCSKISLVTLLLGPLVFCDIENYLTKKLCDNNSPQWANIMAVKLTKGWCRMNFIYEEKIVNLKSWGWIFETQ